MDSDPDLVRYACIAHNESTILAEFNSADSDLRDLAHQCVQRAPPHHSVFSHTAGNHSYMFLFDDPFVFFGIFDSKRPKLDNHRFLVRLKQSLNHLIKSNPHLKFTPSCLQGEFHPIFHKLMSSSFDLDALNLVSPNGNVLNTNPVSISSRGRKVFSVPLLSPSKKGKGFKKKRYSGESMTESTEALVDGGIHDDDCVNVGEIKSRELICQNGVCCIDGGSGGGRQKAKKIWRRHVWFVLVLDLAVCLILFGIWLFVCRGFQCIEG